MYLANQTGRVLLLHWHRPVPLENFLLPPETGLRLDWRVPASIPGFFPKRQADVRVGRSGLKTVRAYPELFSGYESERPEAIFWEQHLDEALQRATTGEFKNHHVLRHRLLGHLSEDQLERRLISLGENDMLHWTPSFGAIFKLFFRPSEGVQNVLDQVMNELGLHPFHYSAVHCRVRHPKATPQGVHVKGKDEVHPADKTGLPWEGDTKLFAIGIAARALWCANFLRNESHEPVYFFSDSNDLVHYMTQQLTNASYASQHLREIQSNGVTSAALVAVKQTPRLVSRRDTDVDNAHIDKQKGRDPPAYYATFVDLYLAMQARCVTYGIGYYAVLATKLSGTKCKLLYQEEEWGGSDNKQANTKFCPVKTTSSRVT